MSSRKMMKAKAIVSAVLLIASCLSLWLFKLGPIRANQIQSRVSHYIERVSVSSDGSESTATSWSPTISAGGRFIAFLGAGSDLVEGDTNDYPDVFVRDRKTRVTERVSVSSEGTEGVYGSFTAHGGAISADGRYVAFGSRSPDMVTGDTNGVHDIFVRDRQTNNTTRVSVAADGSEGNRSSCCSVAISANGRFVAFTSDASNLVDGDANVDFGTDIFVHDQMAGITERVNVASDGAPANESSGILGSYAISADGRYVAFSSRASNLVPNDTNGFDDIFVHDRQTGVTERVSVASDGTEGNRASCCSVDISASGRFVTFTSIASNLVLGDTGSWLDVFVHDRDTGLTQRVSVAIDGSETNRPSEGATISADGRYVAFGSDASNLVLNDANGEKDTFVHDRQTGATERVSVASDGTEGNSYSCCRSAFSTDGRYIVFTSQASNLVIGDTNGKQDVFLYDRVELSHFVHFPILSKP